MDFSNCTPVITDLLPRLKLEIDFLLGWLYSRSRLHKFSIRHPYYFLKFFLMEKKLQISIAIFLQQFWNFWKTLKIAKKNPFFNLAIEKSVEKRLCWKTAFWHQFDQIIGFEFFTTCRTPTFFSIFYSFASLYSLLDVIHFFFLVSSFNVLILQGVELLDRNTSDSSIA